MPTRHERCGGCGEFRRVGGSHTCAAPVPPPAYVTGSPVQATAARQPDPARPGGSLSGPHRREFVIQAAISAGKFPEARRGVYEAMWDADPAGAESLIDQLTALPDVVASTPRSQGRPPAVQDAAYDEMYPPARPSTPPPAPARAGFGAPPAATPPTGGTRPELRALDGLDPVQRLRQTSPAVYAMASRESPPPTAFAEGDMPKMTASGVAPSVLAGLPWAARIAAANAPTAAEVRRIIDEYSGPAAAAAAMEYGGHPAVRAFEQRVYEWAKGPPPVVGKQITWQEYSQLFPEG